MALNEFISRTDSYRKVFRLVGFGHIKAGLIKQGILQNGVWKEILFSSYPYCLFIVFEEFTYLVALQVLLILLFLLPLFRFRLSLFVEKPVILT